MVGSKNTSKLKESTVSLDKENNLKEQIHHLSKAFELFSSETARLEKAYKALNTKFNHVNQKLEERTESLNQKVAELNAVSDYMHQILSNISQGIIFIKPDGIITTYNSFAEKILERPSDHVLFKSAFDIFPDSFLGFSLSTVLREKRAPETSFPILNCEESKSKSLEVTCTILNREVGTPGLLLVLRDITSFKQLQSIANRNDRLQDLGEMAAAVAHEIRNPLGGIEGFASLLTRDLEDQPKLKKMAENIISGSRTLNHLVSHVLNYARPLHMDLQNTSINSVLSDATDLLMADPKFSSHVHISLNLPPSPLIGPIDPNVLKRAILNIMINASQAMPGNGTINLSLEKDGQHASIKIEDTGEGISKDNLNRIFSPFFTTKDDGNGFGLAEVHKIIQAHFGLIEVQSELSKGTTFTIRLPLNQEEKLWL